VEEILMTRWKHGIVPIYKKEMSLQCNMPEAYQKSTIFHFSGISRNSDDMGGCFCQCPIWCDCKGIMLERFRPSLLELAILVLK